MVQRFFGCYLLESDAPERGSKGRTYIGFTTNPRRRLRQHNGELLRGGAKSTRAHRPWKMLLVVHGFRCQVQALQFEWAWQHPRSAKRIQTSRAGKNRRLKALEDLLKNQPWASIPLNVTFVDDHEQMLSAIFEIPTHMRMDVAPIDSISRTPESNNPGPASSKMGSDSICCADESLRIWLCSKCGATNHLRCSAMRATMGRGKLVPDIGWCFDCIEGFEWAEILRLTSSLG
ncbi:hypothetical protein NDN08_007852 [Rhodosorus marinus]|uniref:Structure-specific endonuclease subunit SLX1 homolog n=1 Tax=Rhodosorus marinus TaxID=101924 RepID=A0AAV8UYQ8_9RHOD|nr:hypothetical protein NDN08_007852 [Rhodosorus marinus]